MAQTTHSNTRGISHKGSGGKSLVFPDVCLTPIGSAVVPIPYANLGQALDTSKGPKSVKTDGKMLYHASAVVASNYLVTLLGLAFKLIGKAGIADRDAYTVLKPLIMGTLGNVENVGIPAALTGPISRGDVQTVAQHLDEMKSKSPELMFLYRALGLHTIDSSPRYLLPLLDAIELQSSFGIP